MVINKGVVLLTLVLVSLISVVFNVTAQEDLDCIIGKLINITKKDEGVKIDCRMVFMDRQQFIEFIFDKNCNYTISSPYGDLKPRDTMDTIRCGYSLIRGKIKEQCFRPYLKGEFLGRISCPGMEKETLTIDVETKPKEPPEEEVGGEEEETPDLVEEKTPPKEKTPPEEEEKESEWIQPIIIGLIVAVVGGLLVLVIWTAIPNELKDKIKIKLKPHKKRKKK